MPDQDIKVGDWVRFYVNGHLVIGQVEYISKRRSWESWDSICTTEGSVSADYVLEVRRGKDD